MIDALIQVGLAFWGVLSEMAPYLLFGFLVAGLLSVLIRAELVERHLGRGGPAAVLKASAFGVPLPLCSCGVIPVASSLRRHGASRGATTAFLISTPQTGVDSIFVTYSLLGGVFALFRPIAALVGGMLGGLAVTFGVREPRAAERPACREACCAGEGGSWVRRAAAYGFGALPRDIGKALLVGLAAAAIIAALVPDDFFADSLGGLLGGGIVGMLLMMALGIPVYVCATASVPLAWALIAKGVSPGTALVFLMTGPATNAATLATIARIMGRKTAVIYLLSVAATALAAGMLLDYAFEVTHLAAQPGIHWMLPTWFKWGCAAVLLAVLVTAIVRGPTAAAGEAGGEHAAHEHDEPPARGEADKPAEPLTLRVEGMTCSHCVQAVRRALLESPGVARAEVDLDAGTARAWGAALDAGALERAVEELGYRVAGVGEAGASR